MVSKWALAKVPSNRNIALRRRRQPAVTLFVSNADKALIRGWELRNVMRLGFVGLGDMGGPMALNLVKAEFPVTVFDKRPGSMDDAVTLGGASAASLAEIAGCSDTVCVCVGDDREVLDAVLGEQGLFSAAGMMKTLVIHSTVTPRTMTTLAQAGEARGCSVLDAQVSGGRKASLAGTLTIMVGGDPESFELCRPVFDAVASNVFHVGPRPGAGAAAKLCNNIMALVTNYATLEAIKLAAAYGIPEETMIRVASVSTGNSWWVENWGFFDNLMRTHTLSGDDFYQFMVKDLWDAIAAAREKNMALPLAGIAAIMGPQIAATRDRDLDLRRHPPAA